MSGALEFRLLGPTELVHGGVVRHVSAAKHRTLLAALLLRPGRTVSTADLVDVLWARPPARPRNAVQTYVRRLRDLLPVPVIRTTPTGYLADVPAEAVDLHRFDRLVLRAAREHDPARESRLLREALALWRGSPLSDVPAEALRREVVAGLEAARRRALDRRIVLDLAQGRHVELVTELASLTAHEPLHEPFWGALVLALHRCGRTAEALGTYQVAQHTLVRLTGARPGAELRALHQRVLTADPVLAAPPTRPAGPSAPPVHQLPSGVADFVGREELLDALERGHGPVTVLCGQPGVGKTALAVQLGHRLKQRYPDGQLAVNLRGHSPGLALDPGQVLGQFLRALGVSATATPRDTAGRAALYRELLAGRRVLVLLDDAADAAQVRPLLPGAGCATVVTSRNTLSTVDGSRHTLDVLGPGDSLRLLSAMLGEDVLRRWPAALTRLAGLCAGLPLALRIAAANLAPGADLPAQVARLDRPDRLSALAIDGDTDAAVRVAFAHSYTALPPRAARLFRLLHLVPGNEVTTAAATALLGADATEDLAVLAAANLVQPTGPGRFACHDLLRLYAEERLLAEDPARVRHSARRALTEHYLHTCVHAVRLLHGERTDTVLDVPVPGEGPNPHADAAAAARWLVDGQQALLTAFADAPEEVTARFAVALGLFLGPYRCHDALLPVCATGLAAARRRGEHAAEADLLLARGVVRLWRHECRPAVRDLAGALTRYRRQRRVEGVAGALAGLARVREMGDRLDGARRHLDRAAAVLRRSPSRLAHARQHDQRAVLLRRQGHLHLANANAHSAAELYHAAGAVLFEPLARAVTGETLLDLDQPRQALPHLRAARAGLRALHEPSHERVLSGLLAETHLALGEPETARALLAAPERARPDQAAPAWAASQDHVRLGLLALATGDARTARTELRTGLHMARAGGHPDPELAALLGLARERLTSAAAALPLAVDALELAIRHDRPLFQARAHETLAEAHLLAGHTSLARTHADLAAVLHRRSGRGAAAAKVLALVPSAQATA
ncbi:DNA-binding SARP family transcriptional activator/tetratricopeptide (TPR) repeat protein [Crossiella equi]|uniref:DNA-binding SARP family transcriptional activator/tetratricopeptide (TPR) repeat protein n=1 Tax=Crossiella equi TaxID=130796 RepID=A0ABS5AB22_9PSEU|nr:transcriptional regulator [Crossiella equi]MBP2473776.1 DNA-binding SARP family transcriptional activator/tetratricopeptide (TPR) repeat protein [Crossiella equi]